MELHRTKGIYFSLENVEYSIHVFFSEYLLAFALHVLIFYLCYFFFLLILHELVQCGFEDWYKVQLKKVSLFSLNFSDSHFQVFGFPN
jgi:hypothetical protein